ncbi:serine/threonine protein kinase [Streptacidiphilus pinicola]|uniref:Serine/threonine protein kinase n=1 Tax=Streptacidiphilus pinicola TaxID=2219663 RepID=A0A2X0KI56_9ACTN|nr:serine/threonine protein kinase [Streptacidiphilus pinicola]RAG86440.1 serine/threonine protein kinase [Streptacidiphilus pinicola]
MTTIQGLTYLEVAFDEQGQLTSGGDELLAAAAGASAAAAPGACNVFFMTHGWNNSEDSARTLYQNMFRLLSGMLGTNLSSTIAVGVIWPARALSEDDPAVEQAASPTDDVLSLAKVFPQQQDDVAALGAALGAPQPAVAGAAGLYAQARALVTSPASPVPGYDEDAPLVRGPGAGLGLDLERLIEHVCGNSLDIVRVFTYYEMKNRAGVVGQQGLGPLVRELGAQVAGVRVHLMGHSFGARLVAHALVGLGDVENPQASPVKSVLFLQGAFSHFAFAPAITQAATPGEEGPLAGLTARVDGPLLSTFTSADRALGAWYPMATMIQHEDLALLDHPANRWGAMGHDGFQQANAVTALLAPQGSPYTFTPGTCYRLDANAVINADQSPFAGAHSDICHPEVLWAAASAAQTTA